MNKLQEVVAQAVRASTRLADGRWGEVPMSQAIAKAEATMASGGHVEPSLYGLMGVVTVNGGTPVVVFHFFPR